MPLAASLIIFGAIAWAQDTADQIEDRFERDRQPLSQRGQAIPEFDPLNPPPAAAGITFRLGTVNLVGNTVLSDGDLRQLFGSAEGKNISVTDVFVLANRITAFYGAQGFPLSRAIVPAQEIGASGSITIRVVEGFVDQAVVDEEAEPNSLLQGHARRLESERPISNKTLERELLLADDLPGISVGSVLSRSEESLGGTTVFLDVAEEPLFYWNFTLDNRGSDAVGPWQADVQLTFNNLIHQNSRTEFRIVNSSLNKELIFGTVEHTAVLNDLGTTVSGSLKHSQSEPGTPIFKAIELETEATTTAFEARHPWIRGRNKNLEIYAGLEARDSETQSLGTPISSDKIRSFRFGLDFDNKDKSGGLNTASIELSKGLSAVGAKANDDPLNSREFGLVDYTKATLEVSRTQQLGALSPDLANWSIHGAALGQFTSDPLLSSEECSIGGEDFGRAFDSSTLSGDRCGALSVEVRRQMAGNGVFKNLQLYGFYDLGSVSNIDPGGPIGSVSLASTGLGARFGFTDRHSGSIEITKQLRNSGGGIDDSTPRLFVSFKGEF